MRSRVNKHLRDILEVGLLATCFTDDSAIADYESVVLALSDMKRQPIILQARTRPTIGKGSVACRLIARRRVSEAQRGIRSRQSGVCSKRPQLSDRWKNSKPFMTSDIAENRGAATASERRCRVVLAHNPPLG